MKLQESNTEDHFKVLYKLARLLNIKPSEVMRRAILSYSHFYQVQHEQNGIIYIQRPDGSITEITLHF